MPSAEQYARFRKRPGWLAERAAKQRADRDNGVRAQERERDRAKRAADAEMYLRVPGGRGRGMRGFIVTLGCGTRVIFDADAQEFASLAPGETLRGNRWLI